MRNIEGWIEQEDGSFVYEDGMSSVNIDYVGRLAISGDEQRCDHCAPIKVAESVITNYYNGMGCE